jgi:hypothetical protein
MQAPQVEKPFSFFPSKYSQCNMRVLPMQSSFQIKRHATSLLGSTLAASLMLMPLSALAETTTLKLRPVQKESKTTTKTYYSSGNTASSQNAYDYDATPNPTFDPNTSRNSEALNNNANRNYESNVVAPNTNLAFPTANTPVNADPNASENYLRGRLVSLPKGTLMSVHVDNQLTASASHPGDPVTATLENDVYSNDEVAIPAGSQVKGQVSAVNAPGHLGKHGELDVRFDTIKLPDGKVLTMPAHVVTQDQSGTLKGDTYTKDVFKGVGWTAGGAAAGTIVGTAAGGLVGAAGAGAVLGLGVGVLGGLGYAAARKGHDVIVSSGSRMSIMIDSPVTFNN